MLLTSAHNLFSYATIYICTLKRIHAPARARARAHTHTHTRTRTHTYVCLSARRCDCDCVCMLKYVSAHARVCFYMSIRVFMNAYKWPR